MYEIRTLPPLVRGKVTGVLCFDVDEVRIFRNVLLLRDSCDIVVQVQWWGETVPTFIRPQKINIGGFNRKHSTFETSCQKYEIRTKVDLFKSYLQSCEVLELGVLENFDNLVVGSGFLRDLVYVFNQNDKTITVPLINYAGDEMGEITIHFKFSGGFFSKEKNESETPSDNVISISLVPKSQNVTKLYESDILFDKSNKLSNLYNDETLSSQPSRDVGQMQTKKRHNIVNKKFPVNLPEVSLLSDTSKVLNFNLKNNRQVKTSKKALKPISLNKKSIASKSQLKNNVHKPKIVLNKNKHKNSVPETPTNSIDDSNLPLTNDSLLNVKKTSSKENMKKVMQYLLGSEMNKQDEENALKDLIKMSPSHDLVSSISQLCTETSSCDPNLNQIQVDQIAKADNLNFNLSNPIERNYYEKFFLNSNKSNDFEIVELLNKPNGNEDFSSKSSLSLKAHIEDDLLDLPSKNLKSVNNESLEKMKVTADCPQCKYFKKLGELDSIIESLKHFEKKVLEEKNKSQGC